MSTLKLATPLRPFADGKSEISLHSSTVGEAMTELMGEFPGLKPHLFTPEGDLRAFVHLFVNDEDVEQLQGMRTPIGEADRLMLVPSVAGGKDGERCCQI